MEPAPVRSLVWPAKTCQGDSYYNRFRYFKQLRDPYSQVLITVGATEAIYSSIMAFVNPGDEVLVIEPAYEAYASSVRLAEGKPVFVPLRLHPVDSHWDSPLSSAAFKLDMQELEHKISNKTKILVLNTPNNPTGKVFSQSELEEVAKLCTKHNLLVLADEVYEHIYYSPSEPYISIATLPGMWERILTIGSAGKTFSVTGWKIGWVFGPSELIKNVGLVHQSCVQEVATPLQEAVAQAFEYEMELEKDNKIGFWELELRYKLLSKRNRMVDILNRAQLWPIIPQGSYYVVANFSHVADKFPEYKYQGRIKGEINTNGYKFARWLTSSRRLTGIPVSAFYSPEHQNLGDDLIRFCFIKQEKTLTKMEAIIGRFVGFSNQITSRLCNGYDLICGADKSKTDSID